MPYFAGVMAGEPGALVRSFAGEPELQHPVRGRIKGGRALERFVTETNAWLIDRNAVFGDVDRMVTPRRGVEEVVVTLDGDRGRVELPVAIVADRDENGYIIELRIYFSSWPLTGRHAIRPRAGHLFTAAKPSCALEYNVIRWGRTDLPPEAGIAVYVRGTTGKLAAARIYDDADPPFTSEL